ncbi:MAG: hypothetical protein ACOX19_05755 [Fermentimonas sp.]|jgi:hypothetical protein
MELKELMNAKVSDVVDPRLADEILSLREMQARLYAYGEKKQGRYKEITSKALDHINDVMYQYLLLMSEEFTMSIEY